mgnify:CR=1 FL=1
MDGGGMKRHQLSAASHMHMKGAPETYLVDEALEDGKAGDDEGMDSKGHIWNAAEQGYGGGGRWWWWIMRE